MAAEYLHRIKAFRMFNAKCMKRIHNRRSCYSRSEVMCTDSAALDSFKTVGKSVSKLFLSGREASIVSAIFRPEVDFDHLVDNYSKISEDLKRRKTAIDLRELVENLKIIRTLKEQIKNITEERTSILVDIKEVTDSSRKESLTNRANDMKNKVKDLNTILWNYEELTFPQLTRLPNCIHPDTPSQNYVRTEYGMKDKFSFEVKSHVEIGKLSRCLKFSSVSPSAYYLCNLAAVLELAVCNYFAYNMRKAGFVDIINPDFCKSVILEGCGRSQKEISEYITLKDHQVDGQSLHLTGTASLEGYAATLSRIIVNNPSLPLQYFSIGRCYTSNEIQQSLFSVSQAVTVTAFVATVENESMKHFLSLVDIIEVLYRTINLHFRTVQIAAHLLKPAESLRVGFDLWSPYENKFVNVAHVSLCNDYISRRLLMKHGTERKAEAFLHIVEATVTSLPVIIGCIMENMQTAEGNFSVPDAFKPYVNDIMKT